MQRAQRTESRRPGLYAVVRRFFGLEGDSASGKNYVENCYLYRFEAPVSRRNLVCRARFSRAAMRILEEEPNGKSGVGGIEEAI